MLYIIQKYFFVINVVGNIFILTVLDFSIDIAAQHSIQYKMLINAPVINATFVLNQMLRIFLNTTIIIQLRFPILNTFKSFQWRMPIS